MGGVPDGSSHAAERNRWDDPGPHACASGREPRPPENPNQADMQEVRKTLRQKISALEPKKGFFVRELSLGSGVWRTEEDGGGGGVRTYVRT